MSITKLDKKKYQARIYYRDINGKKKSISQIFERQGDAALWENEKKVELTQGKFRNNSDVGFATYFRFWFENYKEPNSAASTVKRYNDSIKNVKAYFGNTKMREISKIDYQIFINKYGKQHSKASVKKLNMQTRQAVEFAVDNEVIPKDFTHKVVLGGYEGLKEEDKYLEADDFERLTAYVESHLDDLGVSGSMIMVAIHTGARLAEIAGLTDADVSQINNNLVISKQFNYDLKFNDLSAKNFFKPTKTKQTRTIAIPQVLKDFLMAKIHYWQDINWDNNPNHLLFAQKTGKPVSSNACVKTLRNVLKKINAKNQCLVFHGLRHSHASYLLAKKVDLQYVSQRLGHESIQTTIKTYAHLLNNLKEEEASKTVQLLNGLGDKNGAKMGQMHRNSI